MPALFAGGVCGAAAVFEAGTLAGAAGVATGAAEAAGVAAGAAVFDFTGVVAGAAAGAVAAVAGAAADVVDFFERVFLGVPVSALAVPDGGAVAGCSADAVDFFERDFFGVAELSVVALLSAASAFFDVDFFFEDAVFESVAAFELEAAASDFFFLLFAAALESLLLWSPVCCAVCAQTETLPATSNTAPNKAIYTLFIFFILRLSSVCGG